MKKIFIYNLIFTLIFLSCHFAYSRNSPDFKISNYDITAKYQSDKNLFYVKSSLSVIKISETKNINFLIRFKINLKSISAKTDEEEIPVEYYYDYNDTIKIKLPDKFTSNNFKLNFEYDIPITQKIDTAMVMFFWYPYIDGNISYWNVKFESDKDFTFFFPSVSTEDKSKKEKFGFRFSANNPLPRLPIVIIRRDLIMGKDSEINGVKLNYYFYSADTNAINKIISETSCAFGFFDGMIGKYKYSQLNFIEVPFAGVNSQPSLILTGSMFIDYYNKGEGFNRWCAHEIAHQWFGSGAFANFGMKGNSCVFEPLAEYLNLMYLNYKYGDEYFLKELQSFKSEYDSTILNTNKDIPVLNAGAMRVVYLKGPLIYHCIRKMLGEESWKNFLKSIYNDFENSFFTYEDLKIYLTKFDSTGKCTEFLDKWMTEKGLPEEVYF